LTDQQIIEAIRLGDVRKYALLVDAHKDKAFTLALRLVGDRHEAEELVQDAFMRAYRALGSFRGDAKFSTWLYRIVYNLCLTRVSRRRSQGEQLDVHEEMLDNVFVDDESAGADEMLESEDRKAILTAELQQLPENYRVAVTLFYLEEMSYEEMVSVLNMPLGTVKTNLFRGRNLLRQRLVARMKGEVV
jgi:RNA polymerase sigma-70 factor, ECF subfamily